MNRGQAMAALCLAAAMVIICVKVAMAEGFTQDDTLEAIHQAAAVTGVSEAWLYRTVRCESHFDPYAVGRLGELGAAQLASFGELPTFYANGWDDPNNPYQAVMFMAIRFGQGGSRAWSCA